MEITFEEIQEILDRCLDTLLTEDVVLLKNDVSERAITHKLAEYLQEQIKQLSKPLNTLNVDCEYNRNVANGVIKSKTIKMLTDSAKRRRKELLEKSETDEDLLLNPDSFQTVSTYPDIIIHRRESNTENLLVIEVKKTTGDPNHEHDFIKLEAFTETDKENPYKFKFGVFILLESKKPIEQLQVLQIKWFSKGKEFFPD